MFGFNDGYDVQQVCINGHQTTDSYNQSPEFRKSFCDKCGEKTITQCPECNENIKGHYNCSGVISIQSAKVPSHCQKCGSSFPWTEAQKKSAENALISDNPTSKDSVELVKQICQRFHLFARQLQVRHADRDSIEFDDVRAEEYTPSYAGGASRIDFLIHDEQIAIEVKKTRKGLKGKQVGDQIAIDILRYKEHPYCKTLICFVYDPEAKIGNPIGLERDLTFKNQGVNIITIIAPKGN